MSHLDYRPLPLPEFDGRPAERALARAITRWVGAHGGSPRLADLAARAAVAEQRGDTALAPLDAEVRADLAGEALVGDGSERTPFVLDADGRFYLWRNYRFEGEVAAALQALRPRIDDAAGVVMNSVLANLYRDGRDTYYRIHGTTEPWSIGRSVSNGCIRMLNDHVIQLYEHVPVGTPVTVL